MNCEECGNIEASTICTECDQHLCNDCDVSLHKGGKRKSHIRRQKCKLCRNTASISCITCALTVCSSCSSQHLSHNYEQIQAQKRLGVFWDLSTCRPSKVEDIKGVLSEIQLRVG